jgi:hypothetical protein
MKPNTIVAVFGALIITTSAFPQNTSNLAVSDDELLKYATAMDSVSTMQASVRQELGDMIQSKGVMDVQRYNALNKIIDDTAQLETAKATPEEVAFVKEVAEKQKEEVNKIKNTYQALAKDYVTPKVFNKVKKAVETDPKVKKRYDSLMVELKKDNPGE